MSRDDELAEIESYLTQRGATRIPSAFAAPVTAALPQQVEAQRVAAIVVRHPSREEIIARLKRQTRLMFFG